TQLRRIRNNSWWRFRYLETRRCWWWTRSDGPGNEKQPGRRPCFYGKDDYRSAGVGFEPHHLCRWRSVPLPRPALVHLGGFEIAVRAIAGLVLAQLYLGREGEHTYC